MLTELYTSLALFDATLPRLVAVIIHDRSSTEHFETAMADKLLEILIHTYTKGKKGKGKAQHLL